MAVRPVKIPNLNSPNHNMSGKHLSLNLGLLTTTSSSISDWTAVHSKRSKNKCKAKLSDISGQVARKILSSSEISEPIQLSHTEKPKELALMEKCTGDVTREVVDSLSSLCTPWQRGR